MQALCMNNNKANCHSILHCMDLAFQFTWMMSRTCLSEPITIDPRHTKKGLGKWFSPLQSSPLQSSPLFPQWRADSPHILRVLFWNAVYESHGILSEKSFYLHLRLKSSHPFLSSEGPFLFPNNAPFCPIPLCPNYSALLAFYKRGRVGYEIPLSEVNFIQHRHQRDTLKPWLHEATFPT